jgi:hypothetical protein
MDQPLTCPFCGHVRCGNCKEDKWPALADGCCDCVARILRQAHLEGLVWPTD